MKAEYSHLGNDCIIYDKVICVDNVFVKIRTYKSSYWKPVKPDIDTKYCLTNSEARRLFYSFCNNCEDNHYTCECKEQ